jgi:polysaccharide biosynthesis/export protein
MRRSIFERWPALALAAVACAASLPPYEYAREPDPRRQEFVIGPSDVLRVSVWKNNDLTANAVVRPDGTITAPLVGDIPAAGHTPSQVRAEIKKRLGAFLKDQEPQVDVLVFEVNSYQFTVAGLVEHAGLYRSKQFVTVTEALALAGGPTRHASLSEAVVIRPAGKTAKRIPVDIKAILEGERPEMNLVVLTGDTLYLR